MTTGDSEPNRLDAEQESTASGIPPVEFTPDPANEALARPISYEARYGEGKKRTLVLGGGGIYFVAWQVAYLRGLIKRGVPLDQAEIIVGTSAGSITASILSFGGLKRFGKQVDWISRVPSLVGLLAPAANFHPSQARALEMFRNADNSRPETIRAIGHAAMAASTPTAAEMRRSTSFAIAARGWPGENLAISTVDCYTGERLIITKESGISAIRAATASSAVPGVFSPQPIHDRRCMDGGVSGSGTHCDVVAGAEKALVISLGAAVKQEVSGMTIEMNSLDREVAALAAQGTKAYTRGPAKMDVERLMDPTAVPEALALGEEQAANDCVEIAAFWNA